MNTTKNIVPKSYNVDPSDPEDTNLPTPDNEPDEPEKPDVKERVYYIHPHIKFNFYDENNNLIGHDINSFNDKELEDFLYSPALALYDTYLLEIEKEDNGFYGSIVKDYDFDVTADREISAGRDKLYYGHGDTIYGLRSEEDLLLRTDRLDYYYDIKDLFYGISPYKREKLNLEITEDEEIQHCALYYNVDIKRIKRSAPVATIKAQIDKNNPLDSLENVDFVLEDENGKEISRTKSREDGSIMFEPIKYEDLYNIQESSIEMIENAGMKKVGERNIKYFIRKTDGDFSEKKEVNVKIKLTKIYSYKEREYVQYIHDFYSVDQFIYDVEVTYPNGNTFEAGGDGKPDPDQPIDDDEYYCTVKIKYHLFDKEGKEIGDDTDIKDKELLSFLKPNQILSSHNGIVLEPIDRLNQKKDSDGYYVFDKQSCYPENERLPRLFHGNGSYISSNFSDYFYTRDKELENLNLYYDLDYIFAGVDPTSVEEIDFSTDKQIKKEFVYKFDVNIKPRNINTTAEIKAKKVFVDKNGNNHALKKDQFEFILRDEKGKEISRAKNDAEGNIVFDLINFDILDLKDTEETMKTSNDFEREKNIKYYIEEVKGSNTDISYDTHKEEVVIKLKSIKKHSPKYINNANRKFYIADNYSLTADVEYDKDGIIFTNYCPDIVPQNDEEKPDVPDNFVLVEFLKGTEGRLEGTTKYWVNPKANKTIKDIEKPKVISNEGWKYANWDKSDTVEIKEPIQITALYRYNIEGPVTGYNKSIMTVFVLVVLLTLYTVLTLKNKRKRIV